MVDIGSHKQKIADLAIFGGDPTFTKPIVVGQPNIPDIDGTVNTVRDILTSGMLSNNGPVVRQFEKEVCRISGVDHCVATCNATVALEMTARALDLQGEVIVPSFTFIASVHALAWHGLTPIFVDVDPVTHTIDPTSVEVAITSSTSAICGVHLWGNCCDVASLQSIADRNGLALWFDAAHAFSSRNDAEMVGNFGNAEVFSFHATKLLNTFEGGAIVTNDSALAERLRESRNFGFADNGEVARIGVNAKMSEVSAAMGLTSLNFLDQTLELSRRNASLYRDILGHCPGIQMRAPLDLERSNCHYVVCEIDESLSGISRDQLCQILEAEGVFAKRYFYPACHQTAPYREEHLKRKLRLPVTERIVRSVLVLPTGMSVGADVIERICAIVCYAIKSSADIHAEIRRREIQANNIRGDAYSS